jgi:hypothetical protein
MTPTFGSKIRSIGGHVHEVKAVSTVTMKFFSGEIKKLPNGLFSPNIKKNLLSMGFMANKGNELSL